MPSGFDQLIEIFKTIVGPGAIIGLGYWLRGKFADIKEAGDKRMLDHERQDERRHRQNLVRFAKLNTKLGIDDDEEMNGDHDHDHP